MRKITPHLWYDHEAKEAAELYTGTFPDSRITNVSVLHDTPSGDCDVVSFELFGRPFQAISAGPPFKFTPAISLHVACRSKDEVDQYWERFAEGGTALVPLDSYPFAERFGWTADRYGLTWQFMYTGDAQVAQGITPTLMFVGDVCGRAEEAIGFYTSVFEGSTVQHIDRYGSGEEPDRKGTVRHAAFSLDGNMLAAMDSAQDHQFSFNEAISLMVECESQQEIDYFWERLSAVPEAEQCGWLKDKFGVSWQVTPSRLDELMATATEEQMARVTQAFLQMRKFDIAELDKAYQGS